MFVDNFKDCVVAEKIRRYPIKQFASIITKDASLFSVTKENDWFIFEFENGQKFRCKGFLPENNGMQSYKKLKLKKLF